MRALPLSCTVSALIAALKLPSIRSAATLSLRLRSTTGSSMSTGPPANRRCRMKALTWATTVS